MGKTIKWIFPHLLWEIFLRIWSTVRVCLHVTFLSLCPLLPSLLFRIVLMLTLWIMDRMGDGSILSITLMAKEKYPRNFCIPFRKFGYMTFKTNSFCMTSFTFPFTFPVWWPDLTFRIRADRLQRFSKNTHLNSVFFGTFQPRWNS